MKEKQRCVILFFSFFIFSVSISDFLCRSLLASEKSKNIYCGKSTAIFRWPPRGVTALQGVRTSFHGPRPRLFPPWFTLQWSLLDTKEAFVGVGSGDRSKSSLGSFVHNALWKKRVSRQHTTSTSSQNGLLALWNVQGIAAKEGLRFFSLPSKCLLHLNNSKIFRWFPVMFCHAGPGPDR